MITNVTFSAHLTENYKLKAADELISKLRLQLGQEKSYVEELEEELQLEREKYIDLENQLEAKNMELINEQSKVKVLYDKYSHDVQEAVKLDDVYQRQNKKLKESEEETVFWKNRAEKYLAEIIKLRSELESK